MIALYLQISKDGPDAKTMEKELLAWAKSQKGPATWYRDQLTEADADRPHFERLLADVHGGKIRKVAVWRLDQVGRNGPALVKLFDELRDCRVSFVSLTEGIDLSAS